MTHPATTPEDDRADVELRLPADSAYASVLRTTTAALAARLDFTIDDIEDLRIAAGEAGALVLPEADAGADLRCEYFLSPGRLGLRLSVPATGPAAPDPDSFAWQVLSTLASELDTHVADGRLVLTLAMLSGVPELSGPPG